MKQDEQIKALFDLGLKFNGTYFNSPDNKFMIHYQVDVLCTDDKEFE